MHQTNTGANARKKTCTYFSQSKLILNLTEKNSQSELVEQPGKKLQIQFFATWHSAGNAFYGVFALLVPLCHIFYFYETFFAVFDWPNTHSHMPYVCARSNQNQQQQKKTQRSCNDIIYFRSSVIVIFRSSHSFSVVAVKNNNIELMHDFFQFLRNFLSAASKVEWPHEIDINHFCCNAQH